MPSLGPYMSHDTRTAQVPRGPEFGEQRNGFGSLPDAKGLRKLSYAKLNISLSKYWVERSSTFRPGPRR